MALIPALIQLAMSGRGRGGGGGGGGRGYSGGYKGKGGYGGSRGGKEPFDAQAWLDKEAGKDMLNKPFDFSANRSTQNFMNDIFKFYQNSPYNVPAPDMPNPDEDINRALNGR